MNIEDIKVGQRYYITYKWGGYIAAEIVTKSFKCTGVNLEKQIACFDVSSLYKNDYLTRERKHEPADEINPVFINNIVCKDEGQHSTIETVFNFKYYFDTYKKPAIYTISILFAIVCLFITFIYCIT